MFFTIGTNKKYCINTKHVLNIIIEDSKLTIHLSNGSFIDYEFESNNDAQEVFEYLECSFLNSPNS